MINENIEIKTYFGTILLIKPNYHESPNNRYQVASGNRLIRYNLESTRTETLDTLPEYENRWILMAQCVKYITDEQAIQMCPLIESGHYKDYVAVHYGYKNPTFKTAHESFRSLVEFRYRSLKGQMCIEIDKRDFLDHIVLFSPNK